MKAPKKTARARELRNAATPAEIRLWSRLNNRQIGGWRFRRQHPVGPYVLDFYCAELKLAVELDGDSHVDPDAARADARRTEFLEAEGVAVLRFWNNAVREDIAAVCDAIYARGAEIAAMRGLPEPTRRARRQTRPETRIQRAARESGQEKLSPEVLASMDPPRRPLELPPLAKPRGGRGGVPPHPPAYPFEKTAVSRETPAPGGSTRGETPPLPRLAHVREGGRVRAGGEESPGNVLDAAGFAAAAGVSAETLRKLTIYDALLLDANARHNLVARSTLADRWRRHYLDSAQIFAALAPGTKTLVDLGSGAGFPGLVLAAMGEGKIHVKLVESIRKKAAFLSTAAAAMGLSNVEVIGERVESLRLSPPDAITARALAPLAKLLAYAHEIAGENTVCYFLKGQDVGAELTEAAKSWSIDAEQRPSATAPDARLLIIRRFAPLVAPRIASSRVRAR